MLQYELARKIYFSAAHRYENTKWDAAKNKAFFGSCYSEHGHGHNYVLEAYVAGPVDADTGMIINLSDLDRLLQEVVEPLDHHFLNTDLEDFKVTVPTTENIAAYCYRSLHDKLKNADQDLVLVKVRLYENDDLWAEVCAQ